MKGKIILLLTVWFIGVGNAMAQRTVKGTVYSAEDNEPIVGASVVISGTKTGTATDIDGRFTLRNVPNSAKTLLISYVGMKSQTVTIKPEMKIFLESDARSLDEVVVQVAYGSAKKSTLTGAISQVGKEKIELRPVSSVTSALEGTTSGIQINSTYGQPGSDTHSRFRNGQRQQQSALRAGRRTVQRQHFRPQPGRHREHHCAQRRRIECAVW